ncbi:MAG: hypothetical protein IPJ77_16930 [Planctomycetes bacterium]|nr:hypothetical protein [Planctomycetota bacterium]
MKLHLLPIAAAAFLGQAAFAQNTLSEAGSLMLFHEFDNRAGVANLITVTNTANGDATTDTIDVEYVYRARVQRVGSQDVLVNCLETNRTRRLTPNDTLSLLTANDNPNYTQGYLYVFAKSRSTGQAIKFDKLIGNNLVIDGLGAFDYSVNPVVFKAGAALAAGAATDVDSDGIRDLNGNEYAMAADEILIPRFLGQSTRSGTSAAGYTSDLILVNLTGGTQFDAILDFLVYNDNEEPLSAQYQFRCWSKSSLLSISGVFSNEFLLSTNHAVNEIPGANYVKTGWIRIDGNVAYSTNTQVQDPAFLAVLVEKIGPFKAADLPFAAGTQSNGDLLPQSINGDNN